MHFEPLVNAMSPWPWPHGGSSAKH